MRAAPSRFTFRLVGTTFVEGYPAVLDRAIDMLADGPVPARFDRVHDNPHDANAVAVVCVATGGRIGWLPRHLAERVAPCLDNGGRYHVEITESVVHPDAPHNPGLDATATKMEVVDHASA